MLGNFNYIAVFLYLILLSCNDDLVLKDTWEGERLFINAELVVGDSVEVRVTRTFNPILSAYPDNLEVADAKVTLVINDDERINLNWSQEALAYTSPFIVTDSNCYRLEVTHGSELNKSKEVCIPDIDISITLDSLYADNNNFFFSGKISFYNVEAYEVSKLFFFSNEGNFAESGAMSDFDTPCYTRFLDMNCLGNKSYNFKYSNNFFNYEYNPDDYFAIRIFFISKDLEDIYADNQYQNGEFEINGSFSSSFDNAYGVFGYAYRTLFIFPFGG